MRYIQRQNKDVNKDNEIYKKAKNDVNKDNEIYKKDNKDVNKDNELYTKDKQRCKQRQWDIYKGKTKM